MTTTSMNLPSSISRSATAMRFEAAETINALAAISQSSTRGIAGYGAARAAR